MCLSFKILNLFGMLSSWGSSKIQAICAFPLRGSQLTLKTAISAIIIIVISSRYCSRSLRSIYKTQDAGRSFTTVRGLLASMSPRFVGLLERSIADELHNNGFSEKIISELVSGGIRGNYGQDVDVHAFVGQWSSVELRTV